ncbi:hypothetical protein [Streptomyces sp. NPDC059378]|uniref:hypothetical protein n=1 Tax=Streptomyces sp. NPDC059378 TaxID=3346815 RepID=UPI0036A89C2B
MLERTRRGHRMLDPFEYGYEVPPYAPLPYRIWCFFAFGLMHLGWWYGLAQPHLMFPDRHSPDRYSSGRSSEEGTP